MSIRTLKEITVATDPKIEEMNKDCFSVFFRVRETVKVGRSGFSSEFTSVILLCKGRDRANQYVEMFPKGQPILELSGPEDRKKSLSGGNWVMDKDQPDPAIRGWFMEVHYRFPSKTFAKTVTDWYSKQVQSDRVLEKASKPIETAETSVSSESDELF
jgi:hypothetical protein